MHLQPLRQQVTLHTYLVLERLRHVVPGHRCLSQAFSVLPAGFVRSKGKTDMKISNSRTTQASFAKGLSRGQI